MGESVRYLAAILLSVLVAAPGSVAAAEFDGDDYIKSASTPYDAYPITVCAWVRKAGGTDIVPVSAGITTDNNNYYMLRFLASDGGGVRWQVKQAANQVDLISAGAATSNVWEHYAGQSAAAADHSVWVNGGGKATSSFDIGAFSPRTHFTVGALVRAAIGLYWVGDVAYVTVWAAALTDAEILALANGKHPFLVRLGAIRHHYEMLTASGALSLVQDRIGGSDLSVVVGDPQRSEGPLIRRPGPRYGQSPAPQLLREWSPDNAYRRDGYALAA